MKCLLIYTDIGTRNIYHLQHGVAAISAVLKKGGHKTALLYLQKDISGEEFVAEVEKHNPDVVAFSTGTHQWQFVRKYSSALKQKHDVLTVCGGHHATLASESVLAHPDIDIEWVHKTRAGKPDLAASRAAAREMVAGYQIVYEPVLVSMHTKRLAVDMNISWAGTLKIKDHAGKEHVIAEAPHTGAGNTALWAVGATYGVHKLASDPPHWSSNGH